MLLEKSTQHFFKDVAIRRYCTFVQRSFTQPGILDLRAPPYIISEDNDTLEKRLHLVKHLPSGSRVLWTTVRVKFTRVRSRILITAVYYIREPVIVEVFYCF